MIRKIGRYVLTAMIIMGFVIIAHGATRDEKLVRFQEESQAIAKLDEKGIAAKNLTQVKSWITEAQALLQQDEEKRADLKIALIEAILKNSRAIISRQTAQDRLETLTKQHDVIREQVKQIRIRLDKVRKLQAELKKLGL